MTIGERIKLRREELGMSQEELAHDLRRTDNGKQKSILEGND